MKPAAWPRGDARATRLLHLDPDAPPGRAFESRRIGDLRNLLREGDLLVVNDAATLPASLRGVTVAGVPVEVRLAGSGGGEGDGGDGCWRAALFGAGDWRQRTEERPSPPTLGTGEVLRFDVAGAPGRAGRPGRPGRPLQATVASVDARSTRLVSLCFEARGAALWRALYQAGRPVQYAHTARELALWQVQTAYAARPWAAEAPSAGLALTWELLLDLRRRGVGIARVTHAAGLSSTGDRELDARLPLAESYEVPEDTVRAVESARRCGGRVVAVGTTAVRALEGDALSHGGRLVAGAGTTELRLGPAVRRRIVDGILTGVHDPDTSHFALLESFAPRALLLEAHAFAEEQGYLGHEFGDAVLILRRHSSERTWRSRGCPGPVWVPAGARSEEGGEDRGAAPGNEQQQHPQGDGGVGDVEDAGAQRSDADADEVDHGTIVNQSVDEVAQAAAGEQRQGHQLDRAGAAQAQGEDQGQGERAAHQHHEQQVTRGARQPLAKAEEGAAVLGQLEAHAVVEQRHRGRRGERGAGQGLGDLVAAHRAEQHGGDQGQAHGAGHGRRLAGRRRRLIGDIGDRRTGRDGGVSGES
jgi:S-adenosylmethionine:tRNA ribosyltransferase-isomerase